MKSIIIPAKTYFAAVQEWSDDFMEKYGTPIQ
jgi:hypothetical protein